LRVSVTSLQRVLINLIDNALRYGGDNGKVNVHLECDEKRPQSAYSTKVPASPQTSGKLYFNHFTG
jgi:signal transduction histidine kinase